MDALRRSGAVAADDPLATLAPSPGGEEEFRRAVLAGLQRLSRPVLLVLNDLHHLRSEEALIALERLLARAPARLRTIVLSRRDPPLGLHRLRLTGELTEVRAADLEFTPGEAGELMAAAGVEIGSEDIGRLRRRTEGWAAGLRLAAISLARHDDPERFVAEFSGSERTVADYLLSEVLAGRPPEVRDLLLRTSILERVNGPLADLLTGRGDGARLLHELEDANAWSTCCCPPSCCSWARRPGGCRVGSTASCRASASRASPSLSRPESATAQARPGTHPGAPRSR